MRFRDVYVVVENYKSGEKTDWYDYLFHEHQCPTNITPKIVEVFNVENGIDPHGLFRFVACIDDTAENREKLKREIVDLPKLFSLFKTVGVDAPTCYR